MRYTIKSSAYTVCTVAIVGSLLRCQSPALTRHSERSLLDIRQLASQSAEAQRDRLLAEIVAPGGDAIATARTLQDNEQRYRNDLRVRYVLGRLAQEHGRFADAATHYAAVVTLTRTQNDPLGPALAEISASRLVTLRDYFPNFADVFRPVVDGVVADPGNLGAMTVSKIMDMAVRWARERGLREQETQWVRSAGCVTQWTVVGPFGPWPMLRFDSPLPTDQALPLQSEYDLGPGRGHRTPYTIRSRGCAANLGEGRAETGVFVAATDVIIDRDVNAVLRLESPNTMNVQLDGVRVGVLDARLRPTGTVLGVPLTLSPGRHTLRVNIASRYPSPLLVVSLTDTTGRAVGQFVPATTSAHDRAPSAVNATIEPFAVPEITDPFSRYVVAELQWQSRRDAVTAREVMQPLVQDQQASPQLLEQATPLSLLEWGHIALNDTLTTAPRARSRAQEAFRAVIRKDNGIYGAHLGLARIATANNNDEESLTLLQTAATQFADNTEIMGDLADRFIERNWDGEARRTLDRVRELLPGVCWPLRSLLTLTERRGNGPTERDLANQIRQCDALSDTPAAVAERQRRWTEAQTEYERLLANDPEGRGLRLALVNLDREQEQLQQAAQRGRSILPEQPEEASLRADIADFEFAMGRRNEAISLLNSEIARVPSQMYSLSRMRDVLSERDAFGPWRLNGPQVFQEYLHSGHQYPPGVVLALDYTVRRVFSDGSAAELTHNIFHLQTQEAVDEYATRDFPAGVTMLTLRTLKQDGRILEPVNIARLDAVAFPNVQPGDAIEFEYLRGIGAGSGTPGGFAGDRFYFRGMQEPYDRSEWTVILPSSLASQVVIDPRGPAPETRRRELPGGLVELHWGVRESQRITEERRSIALREILPSINIGVNSTWRNYVDAIRDRVADQEPNDPSIPRLLTEITLGAHTASERLAKTHRWVTDTIEHDAESFFDSAPLMVSARSGHRSRVLCYLLRQQRIPCEIAIVRPFAADQTASELAEDNTFSSVMLRVQTERGEQWVDATERGAPLNYLPNILANQPGIMLTEQATRVQLPALDLSNQGNAFQVQLELQPTGAARASVVHRARGSSAVSWRQILRRIDEANLDRQFEQFLAQQVRGAELVGSLVVEGREDPNADVVLRYTFTAPSVAVQGPNGLMFEGLFPLEAEGNYAELEQRSTPLLVDNVLNSTLDLTVSLAPGLRVDRLPENRSERTSHVDWSLQYQPTPNGFRLIRSVRIGPQRITPEEYSTFAAELRTLDRTDAQPIAIRSR